MNYPLYEAENEITLLLKGVLAKLNYDSEVKLEIPPENMGDFAFPCFSLAPIAKKSPKDVARDIAEKIEKGKWVARIDVNGGYVNFYMDGKYLASATLNLILEMKEEYGCLQKNNKKVIIEHTSANPNGPLHVGRARNPIIGDTLVRIFRAAGYNVASQFYLDDLGKQVAILTWGINNIDPNDIISPKYEKPDHKNVGFYQEANKLMEEDETVAKEIGEIVKKSERGDTKTIELVCKAYKIVLEGINESLNRINIHIDKYVPESKFVKDKSVEKVISNLKKTQYCHEKDGALYLDLESFGIHGRNTNFFFLRSDGTSLYATRDIAYHLWKAKYADILINVLGEDHKLEARQIEIALQLQGEKILPKPVFYAFVSMPGGKMSTRRGRVVYLDQLIDECFERAYNEVKKRRGKELSEKKMKEISEVIGIGALRYNLIKVQPEKDIVFKWEEALNFEGNSAPFIQYAHARACSILSKKEDSVKDVNVFLLKHDSELKLIKKLARFPMVIDEACHGYRPHVVTTYLCDIATQFNQFYRDCHVLSEENFELRNSRLALVDSTRIVIRNGLDLLGIVAPEEM